MNSPARRRLAPRLLLTALAAVGGGATSASWAQAVSNPSASSKDPRRLLLPLPAEEDWGFLANSSSRVDSLDALKYIPLGAPRSYLSLGGEARAFGESIRNEGFGQYEGTHTYLEQRYVLHADLHPNANWRAFLSVQSEWIGKRPDGPRPTVDKNRLDWLEGFAEWRSTEADPVLRAPRFVVRVGRQQMDFGAGRLFSSREGPTGEGPNVLQPFDGVRGIWREHSWRVDVFGARPIENRPGSFDDRHFPHQSTWGAYAAQGGPPGTPGPGLDFYYVRTNRPDAAFFGGVADERRNTLGARTYLRGAPYDYDVETFYQFGSFGTRAIRAWAFAAEAGYTVQGTPWAPRLGARAGINSGGGDASTLRGAYVPFPRGVYFGNLSAIGPTNTGGVEGLLSLHPLSTVTATASVFYFWRQTVSDGVYGLPGYPLVPPTNAKRYVGYQPALTIAWQATGHISLNAAYESFQRGSFLRAVPGTRNISYGAAWATFLF